MSNPIMGGIGIGGSILGSLFSAQGAAKSAQAQSGQMLYQAGLSQLNAQIAEQNAIYTQQQGERQAAKYGLGARQQIGQITADKAASGLDVGSGSAKQVIDSQHLVAEMDMDQIRSNAAKAAYDYRTQASADRSQAAMDWLGARDVKAAGQTNVLGSLIGGASSVADKWLKGSESGMWGDVTSSLGF